MQLIDLKCHIKNRAKRYIAFLSILLVLFGSTAVFGEIFPVPNFTYLQGINNQNRLDDDIRQYLRSILSVSIDEICLDNSCLLSPLRLRITLKNCAGFATGIRVLLRTGSGRNLSRCTDNHGKTAFRNLEIEDYPLTVKIPLIRFQTHVASPIEQLINTGDIITRLHNCPDNESGIYEVLFLKLLSLTRDRPVFQKTNLIKRYCRNISSGRLCDEIRDYLSGDDITDNIRRGLTQKCPGVSNCLP